MIQQSSLLNANDPVTVSLTATETGQIMGKRATTFMKGMESKRLVDLTHLDMKILMANAGIFNYTYTYAYAI